MGFKFIHPNLSIEPIDDRRAVSAVVEDCLAERWLHAVRRSKDDILVEDTDGYMFDLGGAVMMDEPQIEMCIHGLTLKTRVRHAESLIGSCRRVQRHMQDLGPHVYFPGRWVKAVVSIETAAIIERAVYEKMRCRIGEVDQLNARIDEELSECGVLLLNRTDCGE